MLRQAKPRAPAAPWTALVCALATLCAACAASSYQRIPVPRQDVEVTSPAVSRLYVLRLPEAKGYYRNVGVDEDMTEIGRIGNDEYLCWERPPGRTLLTLTIEPVELAGGKPTQVFVDAKCEPGRAYYYAISVSAAWSKPEVRELEPTEARSLLAGLSLPEGK